MKTLIKSARILDPSTMDDRKADLLIDGETIASIGDGLADSEAQVIDADGWWLIPGLIDIHSHLREPGAEGKETIETGTRAAAAGGITSVVCMANTNPPVDNHTGVDFVLDRARETGYVRVYPVGAATKGMEGNELAPIGEMLAAGAVAITDDSKSIDDSYVMMRVMEYTTIWQVPVIVHCEDTHLTQGAYVNEGIYSSVLGLRGWPREAESIHVARNLLLAKQTGAHIHIAHVSCADSVDLIRFYRSKGVKVTAETTPQHLLLTDQAIDQFNTLAKVNPPLRTAEDQEALFDGLRDGAIDCIATNHAPHTQADKNQDLAHAPAGVIGFETFLPLLFGPIAQRLGFEPLQLLKLVTSRPATVMGLPGGSIEAGGPADLVLWNPAPQSAIDPESFFSKARNTPFGGWITQGRVETTFVGGHCKHQAGPLLIPSP